MVWKMFSAFGLMSLGFCFLMVVWVVWGSFVFFKQNRNDKTPFECGFDNKENARQPFSLRFFYLLLVFLIFDVELSFFSQVPLDMNKKMVNINLVYSLIVVLFVLGLVEEWREGLLSWRD